MMTKTATLEAPPKVEAEYEVAIDRYISEMKRMKGSMSKRQSRIERLQTEMEALLAELKVS